MLVKAVQKQAQFHTEFLFIAVGGEDQLGQVEVLQQDGGRPEASEHQVVGSQQVIQSPH